jgi:hypothetical protein
MPPRLRILCLHGFSQSGQLFRSKTGSLRKEIGKQMEVEWVYIDGVHAVGGQEITSNSDSALVDVSHFSTKAAYFNSKFYSEFNERQR